MKRGVLKPYSNAAFTLMELLVVIAIIIVLAAIVVPVTQMVRRNANKVIVTKNIQQIAGAVNKFCQDNDGAFPEEDASGKDDWGAAAAPENAKVWYNALPKMLGTKTTGEYQQTPNDFYNKNNILYVPGADYPESGKLAQPLFGFCLNGKLQRQARDDQGNKVGDKKIKLTFGAVTNPARTALFLERGVGKGDPEARKVQSKGRFNGAASGDARDFVCRYGGKGLIAFVDGHVEEVEGERALTETGNIPRFPAESDIIWTKSPDEDPNK